MTFTPTSEWLDWEISERELMECANATIFRDRPDLQFKFDASAPPLMPLPPVPESE